MKLPPLSHLQFVVLECLGGRRVSGRELRGAMAIAGTKKSLAAFYQLMARLEEAKFVEGDYEQKVIEGVTIKERFYRVTGEGLHAMQETAAFYANRTPSFGVAYGQ